MSAFDPNESEMPHYLVGPLTNLPPEDGEYAGYQAGCEEDALNPV